MRRQLSIYCATLGTETNSFSSIPTGRAAFEAFGVHNGILQDLPVTPITAIMHGWTHMAKADGHRMICGLSAFAAPAGPTVRLVYEQFRDTIVADFVATGPHDLVLLNLHGAMVAQGFDDCEGDLLGRLRDIAGRQVRVAALLDLHCHLTDAMLAAADLLVTYKEYPHTDIFARAKEVYDLGCAAAEGRLRPVMAVQDLPIVNNWVTVNEPMRGFVDRMTRLEVPPIASVSFAHGFPWGDVPPGVARTLVVADADLAAAQALADELADRLWEMREATAYRSASIDEALDLVGEPGLTVIADAADNTGGGAPGDSTFIARRAIERGVRGIAIGPLWDPGSVECCFNAEVGATIDLRVGGKTSAASGAPLDVRALVRGLSEDLRQASPYGEVSLGRAAWIEVDGLHLILGSVRIQGFSPDFLSKLGCDVASLSAVVVKSISHFRAGFDPVAARTVSVRGPGALDHDFTALAYRHRSNTYWPRVALASRGAKPLG